MKMENQMEIIARGKEILFDKIEIEQKQVDEPAVLNFFSEKINAWQSVYNENEGLPFGATMWVQPDGSYPIFTEEELKQAMQAFKEGNKDVAEKIISDRIKLEIDNARQAYDESVAFLKANIPAILSTMHLGSIEPINIEIVPFLLTSSLASISDDPSAKIPYRISARGEYNYQKNLVYAHVSTALSAEKNPRLTVVVILHELIHHLSSTDRKVGFRKKNPEKENDDGGFSTLNESMTEFLTKKIFGTVSPNLTTSFNEVYLSGTGMLLAIEKIAGWDSLTEAFSNEEALIRLTETLSQTHPKNPKINLEALCTVHELFGDKKEEEFSQLLRGEQMNWNTRQKLDDKTRDILASAFPNLSILDSKK